MPMTPRPPQSALPGPLTDANAPLWAGPDQNPQDYTVTLDRSQTAEVVVATEVACRRFNGRDVTFGSDITRDDFPLPSVGFLLAQAARQCADGPGFALVRGLPVGGLDEIQAAVMIRGLVAHLAPIATQSRDGDLIRHVRSTGGHLGDTFTRGHQTTQRLWFHTDGADAAVLLCRRAATSGGLSRLASAAAVHNAMLARNPSAVTALFQLFHFHMAGGHVPGLPETFRSPIFSLHRGLFSVRYVRHTLLETPAVTGVPLSPAALDAFDLIEESAHQLSVDMELRAGDLQIVNNHTVLHSRTSYTDPPDENRRRHLLRCWLTFPHYTGRRASNVDEALRYGWLSDDQQRQAATTWAPVPAALTSGDERSEG